MVRAVFLVLETGGTGGTEVYVEGLARHLAGYGKVTVIALNADAAALQNRFPGVSVAAVEGIKGLKALTQTHPDAIYNLHLYSSLLPAVQALRRAGALVVTTLHMPLGPWNILHRMRWRLAVARSIAVIGVSAACLTGYGPLLSGKPVAKVAGPMPLDILPLPRPALPLNPGDLFEVFFVGRLEREKDLSVLVRAMHGLHV
ncbi:MAG: glycosyltransferase [Pseudomonadota bacterium]